MRAAAPLNRPRHVPGRQEMRWRVFGAVVLNLVLWDLIITFIRMLPR